MQNKIDIKAIVANDATKLGIILNQFSSHICAYLDIAVQAFLSIRRIS